MNAASRSRSVALSCPADRAGPVGAALRQVLAHGGTGPLQRAVRRGHAHIQQHRRLAGGPAQHVPGDQRGALPRRQDLERGHERQLDGLPLDHGRVGLLAGRGRLVQQPVRVRLEPGHLGERPQHGGPVRTAAEGIQAHVRGDAVQPGAEQRAAAETVPAAPGTQERLLHRVLGVVERGEHAVAVHVQLAPVPLGEPGERGLVARDRRHQLPGPVRDHLACHAISLRHAARPGSPLAAATRSRPDRRSRRRTGSSRAAGPGRAPRRRTPGA